MAQRPRVEQAPMLVVRDVAPPPRPPAARERFLGLARALRPKQWLKNLLVFAAAGAGGSLLRGPVLIRTGLAFLSFCLVSSAMYLVNDVRDLAADRRHPLKRMRPIASAEVPVPLALGAALLLVATGSLVAVLVDLHFAVVIAAYVAVSIAYTLGLKRLAVLEIVLVASGFVLRAVGGSAAAHVPLSQWFVILTSFGSLFVVAGKRFAEFRMLGDHEAAGDPPLDSYTLVYLRFVWMMAASVSVIAYCLWAFVQPHVWRSVPWSELSAVPFVLAVLRYALDLETGHGGAPEDLLLGDRVLGLIVLVWLAVYSAGVWLGH